MSVPRKSASVNSHKSSQTLNTTGSVCPLHGRYDAPRCPRCSMLAARTGQAARPTLRKCDHCGQYDSDARPCACRRESAERIERLTKATRGMPPQLDPWER